MICEIEKCPVEPVINVFYDDGEIAALENILQCGSSGRK